MWKKLGWLLLLILLVQTTVLTGCTNTNSNTNSASPAEAEWERCYDHVTFSVSGTVVKVDWNGDKTRIHYKSDIDEDYCGISIDIPWYCEVKEGDWFIVTKEQKRQVACVDHKPVEDYMTYWLISTTIVDFRVESANGTGKNQES